MNNDLLILKKRMRMKLPRFVREDSQRKEVSAKWRKPQGQQNKVRKGVHGHIAMVKKGYRTPAETRGMTLQGLNPVLVRNEKEIDTLKKTDIAIISAGTGNRKKKIMLKKLQEKGINILNCRNPKEEINNIETQLNERKKTKLEKTKLKEQKKETKKEAKDKKQESALAEKISDEEKKIQEKKELDKLLTKGQ